MLDPWLVILGSLVLLNALFYFVFAAYSFAKQQAQNRSTVPVSVVVCAKNEADHLRLSIPKWLAQDYPNFELVVVNDASTDETDEVLETLAASDSRLQVVTVANNEAFWANKKYALTLGIKKAKNELLIFADPKTTTLADNWLAQVVSGFQEGKDLVLGYARPSRTPGLLNWLERYDNWTAWLFNVSFSKLGQPLWGSGKNLAYRSQLFYDNRGFMDHMHVRAGEDILFVNRAATGKNTAVADHPAAQVEVQPKDSYGAWLESKKIRRFVFKKIKPAHQLLLGLYPVSVGLFWLIWVLSFFFLPWQLVAGSLGVRLLLFYVCTYRGAAKLGEKQLLYRAILLEPLHIWVQLRIFVSGMFSKPNLWK